MVKSAKVNALSNFKAKFRPKYEFWQVVGDLLDGYDPDEEVVSGRAIIVGVDVLLSGESFDDCKIEYQLQKENGYLFGESEEGLTPLDIKAEDLWIFDRDNNEKLTWAFGGEASLETHPEAFAKIAKPTNPPIYQIGDLVKDSEWSTRFGRRQPGLVFSDELATDQLSEQYGCLIVTGVWWRPPELTDRQIRRYRPSDCVDGWCYMTAFFDAKTNLCPDILGAFSAKELTPFVIPDFQPEGKNG